MLNDFDSIYLDFDGTITKRDTVNLFFNKFCTENWLEIEQEWIEGKITSKKCMQLQLNLIKKLTAKKLEDFIDSFEIQDGFLEFYNLAKKYDKKIIILSDGFDLFISKILQKEGISDIEFYANKLNMKEENGFLKFSLDFPFEDKNCSCGLGMCKCARALNNNTKNKKFIYAGDGLSDRCIAKKANLVFAKNRLKEHCLKTGLEFVEFENFFDIANHLKKRSILRKDWQNAECKAGFKTEN